MPFKSFKRALPLAGWPRFVLTISMLAMMVSCATAALKMEDESILSHSDERMLWRRAVAEQGALAASGKISSQDSVTAYVNQVAEGLRPEACPPELKFRVIITKDPFPNAYAYPDGVIVITTGLLARLDNEAQLAAVLAHEMAHGIGRDALRAYRRCSEIGGVGVMTSGPNYGFKTPSDSKNTSKDISKCMQAAVRTFEFEADALSLDMLIRAHYDPFEALRVFYIQKEALALDGTAPSEKSETHPLWDERINALDRLLITANQAATSVQRGTVRHNNQIQPVLLPNARLNLRYGRYRWARLDLMRLLEIQPDDVRAHYLMGESYQQQGGRGWRKTAEAYYLKAIQLDDRYAPPHRALGMLHFKQGSKRLARRYFQTALNLAPGARDNSHISHYLGQCQN